MKIMKPGTRREDDREAEGHAIARRLRSQRARVLVAFAAAAGGVWLAGCGSSDSGTPANTAGTVSFAGTGSSSGGTFSSGGTTSSTAGADSVGGGTVAGGSGGAGSQPPKVGGACSDTKACAVGLTCQSTADGKGECSKACTADTDCVMGSTAGICASDMMCHLPCTAMPVAPATICKRKGWVCDPGGVYCVAPAGTGGTGAGGSGGGGPTGGTDSGGSGGTGGLGEAGQVSAQ
jgi:hypothetical protein